MTEFMQKVFRKDAPAKGRGAAQDAPQDDAESASRLIERASLTIGFLASRCEILDTEINQARARGVEQDAVIEKLMKLASDLKTKIESLEGSLKSAVDRYASAEACVVDLEEYKQAATARATRAEGIASRLQQQVEDSFGDGSPIRSVMNLVVARQAAE